MKKFLVLVLLASSLFGHGAGYKQKEFRDGVKVDLDILYSKINFLEKRIIKLEKIIKEKKKDKKTPITDK